MGDAVSRGSERFATSAHGGYVSGLRSPEPSMRHTAFYSLALLTLLACDKAREVPQHSVADFYKNVQFGDASFSHDNSKILVISNQTGIYNAYAIPVGGGAPQALTTS